MFENKCKNQKSDIKSLFFLYFEVDFMIGKRGLGCSVGALEWWGRLQAPDSRLQAVAGTGRSGNGP